MYNNIEKCNGMMEYKESKQNRRVIDCNFKSTKQFDNKNSIRKYIQREIGNVIVAQRCEKKSRIFKNGNLEITLKKTSFFQTAQNVNIEVRYVGMNAVIVFYPSPLAPDAESIKFVQVVRANVPGGRR